MRKLKNITIFLSWILAFFILLCLLSYERIPLRMAKLLRSVVSTHETVCGVSWHLLCKKKNRNLEGIGLTFFSQLKNFPNAPNVAHDTLKIYLTETLRFENGINVFCHVSCHVLCMGKYACLCNPGTAFVISLKLEIYEKVIEFLWPRFRFRMRKIVNLTYFSHWRITCNHKTLLVECKTIEWNLINGLITGLIVPKTESAWNKSNYSYRM